MPPFDLDLYLEKTKVIRGESIRFVATLTSKAKGPHEISGLDPESRALEITVTDEEGGERSGDALNLSLREGDDPVEDKGPALVTLAPGGKLQATGDVLTWIGELTPGEYRVHAAYDHASFAYAESKEIAVTVAPASPLSATTTRPSVSLAYSPRLTAWRNGSEASPELFLLETSPFHPEVFRGNRRLAALPAGAEPLASTANRHPPAAIHLVWLAGPSLLKALRLPEGGAPEKPVDVPLPTSGLRPVREPFSDGKGGLAVVLVAPDLRRGMLVRLPAGGKPTATPVNLDPPLGEQRQAFWTRGEELVLLWTGPDGRELFGAMTKLASPANPLEGKRLFTAPFRISHVRAYQDYDSRKQTYGLKCLLLCHDRTKDVLVRLVVNLATGAVESRERSVADGLGRVRVLASEMNADHEAAFLFADPAGSVLFGPPDLKEIRPLEVVPEEPVTVAMSPALLAPNRFSGFPGHYLIFVRDGERFEVRKL